MKIPFYIINEFEKEINSLKFGKVSLCVVLRGEHYHFEVDKHCTIYPEEDKNIHPLPDTSLDS